MTVASPAKLRSGEWGAKVNGSVSVGAMLTIRTAAGKEWQATVAKVVWSGDGVTLCATQSADRPAARTTYSGRIEASRKAWGARRGMGSGHGSAPKVAGYSSYCTDNDNCRCYDCAS